MQLFLFLKNIALLFYLNFELFIHFITIRELLVENVESTLAKNRQNIMHIQHYIKWNVSSCDYSCYSTLVRIA